MPDLTSGPKQVKKLLDSTSIVPNFNSKEGGWLLPQQPENIMVAIATVVAICSLGLCCTAPLIAGGEPAWAREQD